VVKTHRCVDIQIEIVATVANYSRTTGPVMIKCCSTPPTRTEAFEEFKKDAGSEIQRILVENKGL